MTCGGHRAGMWEPWVLPASLGGCKILKRWAVRRFAGQLPTPRLTLRLSLSLSEPLNSLWEKEEQQPGKFIFFYRYYRSGILLQWKRPILILETNATGTNYILSVIIIISFFPSLFKIEDWAIQMSMWMC